MGKLIMILMMAGCAAVGSLIVWGMEVRRARFANKHGIIYCPRCDSDMVVDRQGAGSDFTMSEAPQYACQPCGHEFAKAGHVPAPLA